jgi:ligand-binding sensor domain-containing protein
MKNSWHLHPALLLVLFFSLSACAPGAGIFAGGNWQSSGLSHQHIRTLEVDPNNSRVIYAGDAQDGVFVSNDSGQHWTQRNPGLPLPLAIQLLAVDGSGKKLYAATDKGLFVSADAAQNWQSVGAVNTDVSYTALAFDFSAPHTIYAGTQHQGVLVSTDDGHSWASGSNGLPVGVAINGLAFDSVRHQLWAATASGIYRSDDRGATWRAFNSGLPPNTIVYDVQPASVSGGAQNLIFAGTNFGFFRSEDAGAHWTRGQEAFSGTRIHQVLVDFRTPTTIYLATDAGAFRSDNSGQTWGGIASGLPKGSPVYALTFGADSYSQLYAAVNDVYLYPGSSGGLTITRLIPILLILLFFYLLYRLVTRTRRRSQQIFASGQRDEEPSLGPLSTSSEAVPQDRAQLNGIQPAPQRQEAAGDDKDT